MPSTSKIAFVTIGQTPRIDVVPEMMAEIGIGLPEGRVEFREFGVLDGMGPTELDAMRAVDGEHSFATRLKSGQEIVTSKARTEEKLNGLLSRIDAQGFDLVVLLCTGTTIDPLENTLVVEAQRIVDSTVEALAASSRRLGVILPLERQVKDFADRHVFSGEPKFVAASPYAGDDIGERAKTLEGCDLIVMHCMGYSAGMLDEVRRAVDAPVLLSRRVVAGVVRQMI
ncbi:AroM family protein [Neorhizobium galegae]|uniref:AroM family protein n=1 Tax=Neorhizobium galegae TaxID=399 RepID=UPI001F45188B|nr:AroM family protein [Neorhizobium galegae]UIK04655.1 AroM family protein [Neorhizobium galegae]